MSPLDRPDNDPPRPERAKPEELRDWETIQSNDYDATDRLRIVSGWLYRTTSKSGFVAMVYVPSTSDV